MAAWVLGELKAAGVVSALMALLEGGGKPGTRESVIEALGKIGDRSCVGTLTRHVGGWPLKARMATAEALGRLGGPDARAALQAMLIDPSAHVRQVAEEALDFLGI